MSRGTTRRTSQILSRQPSPPLHAVLEREQGGVDGRVELLGRATFAVDLDGDRCDLALPIDLEPPVVAVGPRHLPVHPTPMPIVDVERRLSDPRLPAHLERDPHRLPTGWLDR